MATKPYNVGYGKPPAHSQFKPGQSGNTKGRPKGGRKLVTDLALELAEKIQVTENGQQRHITKQRAMLKAMLAKSVKGDVRAATLLMRLIPEAEAKIEAEQEKYDNFAVKNAIREAQLILGKHVKRTRPDVKSAEQDVEEKS